MIINFEARKSRYYTRNIIKIKIYIYVILIVFYYLFYVCSISLRDSVCSVRALRI